MVLDVHALHIAGLSCPLGPWPAIFGFPRWLCWLTARNNGCTIEYWRKCPLASRGEFQCDGGANCSPSEKDGPRR